MEKSVIYGASGNVYLARQVWMGSSAINTSSIESYVSICNDLPPRIPVKAAIAFPSFPMNEDGTVTLKLGYQTGTGNNSEIGSAFFRNILIR